VFFYVDLDGDLLALDILGELGVKVEVVFADFHFFKQLL
jgi:hypothetical protein